MNREKIKTDWGSLVLGRDGNIVVCMRGKDGGFCIRFSSLAQVKQAIDSVKISVKKWAVAVPRDLCILKPLSLPASNLAEAAKMIEFELASLVPLPLDKIVYGCTPLSKQGHMLNVLVCILKLSALDQILEPYKAIGVRPSMVILNSLAIQNWFNAMDSSRAGSQINILVHEKCCEVSTSIDGNFQLVREFALDYKNPAESSRAVAQQILHQQQELGASAKGQTRVFLAGTKEHVLNIKGLLDNGLGDVSFGNVSIAENPKIVSFGDEEAKSSVTNSCYDTVTATGLLGFAANPDFQYSNLLPPKYLKKANQKTLILQCATTCSLSVVLLLLLWACFAALNWRITKQCRMIESKIAPVEHIASSVAKKRQRVRGIQKQLSSRGQIAQVLAELYKYTPEAVSIGELKFTSTATTASIDIKGRANSLSDAFEYSDVMSKAEMLNKIQIINAQQIPKRGGSVVEFKAHCVVKND